MPLSGFTHTSCYTRDYFTSSRERHSSSFSLLLFLCIWIKVTSILLCSQSPKNDFILTWSHEFLTELRYWDLVMPPSFNRHWVYPVNNPYYDAGNQFFPTVNSHRIAAVISSSFWLWMMTFDACTKSIPMVPHYFFGSVKYFSPTYSSTPLHMICNPNLPKSTAV